MRKNTNAVTRFLHFVHRQEDNDCWEWEGASLPRRYGLFTFDGERTRVAHKLMLKLWFNGLPHGLLALHACDNPKCVNPNHLWLGTSQENSDDCVQKNRQYRPKGEQHNMAKLTEADVRSIRQRYALGHLPYKSVAAEYGVTAQAIFQVVRRIHWKHI